MACFNSESMKDLERTLRTSIQNVLEDAAAYSTFETSVKAFDSKASPPQVILPASVGAAIAAKWINQLISNDDGSKLLRLLCYYQLPYKKAVYFNLLTTGILSFCHQALVTMQKDALKTLLSETIKLHHLAIALAKVLQQSLRLDDMKKTIICVRPKYIKASAKISSPDAAQQLAQLINKIYIPLLAPTLRLVGLAATGTAEETRRFDFSVEAGMTQAQATHLIASIDQARDMLELNDQWYNFFKKERKDKALQWFNKDTDVQKKIKTIYLDMFKQQILKSEINTKTFKKVISTSDAPTERSETFFDDKFNITPMAIFYQHFVSGDPVQLRLFSDEDSGDESRFEGSSSTSGSFGVSLFRDCHLTPLGSEMASDHTFEVGGHNEEQILPASNVDTKDYSMKEKRKHRREAAKREAAEKARDDRMRHTSEKHAADFFSRLVEEGGKSFMKRMVIRIRVDLFSNEAVALKDIGAEIYINNRFFIAMTLIHELMHTWFGMDDFHYADIIGHLNCDKKEGVYYSGLVLGEQSAKDTLKALQDDDYYPKGTQFNLDQYTWQINNVDNYVLAITKIYFLDEVMCKHQSKNGYPNALKDKKALAKTRLAYLAAYNVHNKPGTIKMNRLLEAEKDCWARESGDYNDLMTTMVASNSHVDRFSQ